MDGREWIAVKILTIVLRLLVSIMQHVSMVLVVSIVDAFPARRVYFVIWKMLAHRIHVTWMLFVIQVRLMDLILVHVLLVTKALIVPKTLMNVHKDHHANITASVLIHPAHLLVTVHEDSLDHDAKQMSTNAKVIHAKMMVAA